MKLTKILTYIPACIFMLLCMWSCEDDFQPEGVRFIEGTANLNVTVSFDLEAGVDLTSRAAASPEGGDVGTAIGKINDLSMLVYDQGGNLIKKYDIVTAGNPASDPDIENVVISQDSDNRLPDEVEENNPDSSLGRVDYKLRIQAGRYYIYAVANMGNLNSYDRSAYASRHALKSIQTTWQSDVSTNAQMFGVYSMLPNRDATDDSPTVVSADHTQLHAWVRRLASKVTVAFDGSELFDDVQVFIETVTIKDIPKTCYLGLDNTPGLQADGSYMDHSKANRDRLLMDGKTLKYQTVGSAMLLPENLYHVCNGKHKYFGKGTDEGDTADDYTIVDNIHTNDYAHSLFFYENKQGTGKSKKQSQDGISIDYPNWAEGNIETGWKDNKPFGTYVEVTGMYRCARRDGNMSSGPIKYRFMLGQDTDCDYNATRNTHYKLTLAFKGYGNDADWHIEYNANPGIYVNSPQFISYLYNKKMMATVKIVGEIHPQYPYLFATILGTRKSDLDGSTVKFPMDGIDKAKDEDTYNTYWRPWGEENNDIFPPMEPGFITDKKINADVDGPWSSFLSLRKTQLIRIDDPDYPGASSRLTDYKTLYNRTYWENNDLGWRIYDISKGDHPDGNNGQYSVTELNHGQNGSVTERMFTIPLYTRAKELITKTGFTGNNPYSSYPRMERIRFSVVLKDPVTGGPVTKHVYLDMIQVRRIENPKGVWRRGGSTEGFNATLTHRPKGYDSDFKELISSGKWSAEVYAGDPIITLSTTTKGSGDNTPQNKVMRIEGKSEHPIDFMINFNGSKGFAIVRVRYNNYTCEHDIFCRNGHEDDVQLTPGGPTWTSRNVYRFNGTTPVFTNSPLEQGSFFRRGSYTAILEENDKKYGLGVIPPSLESIDNKNNKKARTWAELQCTDNAKFKAWTISGDDRIATIDDFYSLTSTSTHPEDILLDKAYGVVYGDGATVTQLKATEATGFERQEVGENGYVSSIRGMRGVIIYNKDNAKQLFLPIGMTGYGRRKDDTVWESEREDLDVPAHGVLRYAGRKGPNTSTNLMSYNPLFFDIYIRPGAIYWCRNWVEDKGTLEHNGQKWKDVTKSSDFDINYFTMGFEGFEDSAAGGGGYVIDNNVNKKNGKYNEVVNGSRSSACFIRIVKK